MAEETLVLDPRDWITPPFTTCPFCGKEQFGLLMVTGGSYVKRCRGCMEDEQYSLPELTKKVLYLDQFAVSNLMKVLHPDHRHRIEQRGDSEEGFWLTLFDKLERLVKLQVLVSPWSQAHWEESFVAAHFEELRRIYEHLAGDLRFEEPGTVKHGQIVREFERWLGDEMSSPEHASNTVLRGNVTGWMPKLRVHARLDPGVDVAEDLRRVRGQRHAGLSHAVEQWRSGPRRGFHSYFEAEVAGYGEAELRAYGERLRGLVEIIEGRRQVDEDIVFPTNSQILIMTMKEKLDEQSVPREEQIRTLREFFQSAVMQRVPFLRISAGMLAALAVKASLQQAPTPNQGMVTDINVVATYLPFCDAIFIDSGCADLLAEADRELEFGYPAQAFTPRSRERLLEWLEAVEAETPPAHVELVERVYGPSWLVPYREIFQPDGPAA